MYTHGVYTSRVVRVSATSVVVDITDGTSKPAQMPVTRDYFLRTRQAWTLTSRG